MKRYFWPIVIGLLLAFVAAPFMPVRAQTPEVVTLIYVAADRHGVDPALIDRIVDCESDYRPGVMGPDGSMGIAQFQQITWGWASTAAGWGGASPYDAEAALDVMAWLLARGGAGHWWACL